MHVLPLAARFHSCLQSPLLPALAVLPVCHVMSSQHALQPVEHHLLPVWGSCPLPLQKHLILDLPEKQPDYNKLYFKKLAKYQNSFIMLEHDPFPNLSENLLPTLRSTLGYFLSLQTGYISTLLYYLCTFYQKLFLI